VFDFLIMTKSVHPQRRGDLNTNVQTDYKYGKRRSAIKKTVPIART